MSFTNNQKRYLKKRIRNALAGIDPSRYRQEPHLQGVVFGKLDGFTYTGKNEVVVIKYTGVDDHGPGAAEKRTGADFAVTITRYPDSGGRVDKATLGQAKNGAVEGLASGEQKRLQTQIANMSDYTASPLVVELPEEYGRLPKVRITQDGNLGKPMGIDKYLVDHLIACTHGDTRKEFIESAKESSLSKLDVISASRTRG